MSNEKKTGKHLLFFSNLCEHSNEIYQQILKYNLKEDFYLIDVSLKKFKIQSNITSVPSIILSDKKTIIKDDELKEFINNLNKKNEIVVEPYYLNGGLLSDNFSSLIEEDNNGSCINKGFEYINDINKLLLVNDSSKNIKDKKENKGLMSNMDTIQQDRNKDIQSILNRKPRPVK